MSTSSKLGSKATHSSKATNAGAVLELLKDVGNIGESVPYLEAVAGLLKTIIEMKQEYTESKEQWLKTMDGVRDIQRIIADTLGDDRALPPPAHLKEAMAGLQTCALGIAEAFDRLATMNSFKRFLHRRELKADAEACAADVGRALVLFQTKLQVKLAVQVDAIHTIITGGTVVTSIFSQTTLPVCPSPSDFFTGRSTLLESLNALFDHPGRRVVTIIGKGGAGKTQLTLKFAEQQKARFSAVFFVDATSIQTIQGAFGSIAKAHSAGSSVEDARNWFAGHAEEWLLVFDNADDPSLDLGQYLPRSSHGNIIVTSRNHEVSHHASLDCSILLPDLDESDAVDLLLKTARLKYSPDHRILAADIVRVLGYLALAVSHAGTYISQSSSIQNYLPLFRTHRSNLLKRKRVQNPDGYSHTVFSAFELSYLQLSETAKSFLHVLSFFHHSNIPLQLFSRAAAQAFTQISPSPARQHLQAFLSHYCDHNHQWQPLLFQDIVAELQQSSIILSNRDALTISFHSIIHACAGDVVETKDLSHAIALELLYAAAPIGDSAEDVTLCMTLASHTDHLWNYRPIPEIFSHDANIRNTMAYIFQRAGSLAQEESMRLEVVAIRQRVDGVQHPDTLGAMNDLASTLRCLGRLDEAEELGTEVLGICREVLGERHLDTLRVMGTLASTYNALGESEEAVELEEDVLRCREEFLGDDHVDTLGTMGNLAATYRNLGRLDEAEVLQQKVLGAFKEILGEKHPDTLQAMGHLAATYDRLGLFKEAAELEEDVLRLRREVLGERHPDTLRTMDNLASTYSSLGLFNQAMELGVEEVRLRRAVYGERHPDTWRAMGNLAVSYHCLGRFDEVEALLGEVLMLQKEVIGEYHPDTLRSMGDLAKAYHNLGRFGEAEKLKEERRKLRHEYQDVVQVEEHHPA